MKHFPRLRTWRAPHALLPRALARATTPWRSVEFSVNAITCRRQVRWNYADGAVSCWIRRLEDDTLIWAFHAYEGFADERVVPLHRARVRSEVFNIDSAQHTTAPHATVQRGRRPWHVSSGSTPA